MTRVFGSDLRVGDTIGVWWAPNRETIIALRPYTGKLDCLAGARIATFAARPRLPMTIEAEALFDLHHRSGDQK